MQTTIKNKLIANVLTLALDMLNDSHRISNQVLILIVQYSVELSPSPVCVAATPGSLEVRDGCQSRVRFSVPASEFRQVG